MTDSVPNVPVTVHGLESGRGLLLRGVAVLTQIVRRREESGSGTGRGAGAA